MMSNVFLFHLDLLLLSNVGFCPSINRITWNGRLVLFLDNLQKLYLQRSRQLQSQWDSRFIHGITRSSFTSNSGLKCPDLLFYFFFSADWEVTLIKSCSKRRLRRPEVVKRRSKIGQNLGLFSDLAKKKIPSSKRERAVLPLSSRSKNWKLEKTLTFGNDGSFSFLGTHCHSSFSFFRIFDFLVWWVIGLIVGGWYFFFFFHLKWHYHIFY